MCMAVGSISERGGDTPPRRWPVILQAPRNVPCASAPPSAPTSTARTDRYSNTGAFRLVRFGGAGFRPSPAAHVHAVEIGNHVCGAQPAAEARRQPVWRRQFRNAPNPHVRFAPACWAAWRGLDTFRPYIGRFVTNPLASLRLRGSASPARPDPLTQLQARSRRGPVGSAPPRGPCIACARRLQLSVARFRSYGGSRTKE
jgi:hypothetical protein